MKKLALFDFDHCLTSRDSFLDFIRYCFSSSHLYFQLAMLIPYLISGNEEKAKELLMRRLFKSWTPDQMKNFAESFVHYRLPEIMNKTVLDNLMKERDTADVFVVSASLDLWLKPWCEEHKVGLICTEFDLENKRLLTPNCKGEEKVRRIKEQLSLSNYQDIYCVGNLPQDAAMLKLGNRKKVVK